MIMKFFWSSLLLLSEGHAIFLLFLGKSQNKIQTEITVVTKRRNYRSSHQSYSARKGVLRNFAKFTGRHLSQSLFLNKVAGFRNYRSSHQSCSVRKGVLRNFAKLTLLKKETLAQVFSCEFPEISKNTFSYRAPSVAASVLSSILLIRAT